MRYRPYLIDNKRVTTRTVRHATAWLLALALLGGCSWIPGYAWDRFGTTLVSRTDEWLALDAEHKDALRARMAPWLDELRRERLPRYAAFLRTLAERTRDGGFDAGDAAWLEAHADLLYQDAVESALAWIAPTLADIDTEQRRHLAGRMREVNAEYRADHVDGPRRARAEAMARRIIDQVERWTGDLEWRQRRVVHEQAAELPDTVPDWYRYRLRMQAGLLALLHAGADERALRAHLTSWWIRQDTRRPGERRASQALRAGLRALLVELYDALSPSQRDGAIRRLRSVADDLDTITTSAPTPADE